METENHRNPNALTCADKDPNNTFWAADGARKAARYWAKKLYKNRGLQGVVASTSTVIPDETGFVVDPGASIHMMSKTDLSREKLETLKVSRLPTIVSTENGSIDTIDEEAIVCVKDLDVFVTVQLLQNTPEALSLGKLCEEHG